MKLFKTFLATSLFWLAANTHAGWVVDDQVSHIHYLPTKILANDAGSVTEQNTFDGISGQINDLGVAEFTIDLTSIDTSVTIRNERILKYVFDVVAKGSTATLKAEVPKPLLAKPSGTAMLPATLMIGSVAQSVELHVAFTKTRQGIQVTSIQPTLVKAHDFGLTTGFNKLVELAGLSYIPMDIPVSFQVFLKATEK